MSPPLEKPPFASAVRAGVARRDITPPVGIYCRMWGAAKHDTAEGVHRPITATALALQDHAPGPPLILVSLDWCHLADPDDLARLRQPLIELAGGAEARVILACTHTHSVGYVTSSRTDFPGGHLIRPYLDSVEAALASAAREAVEQAESTAATITWAYGRCGLAANRDLQDPAADRVVTGFNPDAPADDTLLVARITRDSDDAVLATLVNYACHPTTLAWENKLLSPDYVGACREVLETVTRGAPCLFLQGASGDLAPPYQYVGNPEVADQHGRVLGHAALSVLYSMPRPRHKLTYQGVVESGAPLAVWRPEPFEPPGEVRAEVIPVQLPIKPLPSLGELEQQLEAATDRALAERIRRKMGIVAKVGAGPSTETRLWAWRLGQALVVAQPNEAYSVYQQTVRERFKNFAVAVLNVANGAVGYICPDALHDLDLYQVWQSPYDRGAMPALLETTLQGLDSLTVSQP